jgi:hypothetical protein
MARIKKLLPLLVIVLVALIAFGLFQTGTWPFGGGSDEDTTDTTTSKVAKTSTTAAAGSSGVAVGTAEEQALQYASDLKAWRAQYWDNIDAGAFTFKKVTAPTKTEIARAQAVADQQTAAAAALESIAAPQPVAVVHAQYIAVIAAEARAVQRMMTAIKDKSWRDVELAMRSLTESHTLEIAVVGELDDYMSQFRTASASATDTAGYATFSDAKLGFTVQYPKAWQEFPVKTLGLDAPADAAVTAIAAPEGGTFGTVPANYILFGADPYEAKEDGTSRSAVDGDLEAYKTTFPGYTIVSEPREFQLQGLEAAEVTIGVSVQGHTLIIRTVYAHTDTVSFTFQLCAEATLYEANTAVFEAVLNSLKVGSSA